MALAAAQGNLNGGRTPDEIGLQAGVERTAEASTLRMECSGNRRRAVLWSARPHNFDGDARAAALGHGDNGPRSTGNDKREAKHGCDHPFNGSRSWNRVGRERIRIRQAIDVAGKGAPPVSE